VRPGHPLVIGWHGIRAGGRMRSFGYAGGITPAAWLEGPGTTVFHGMRELPALPKCSWATLMCHDVAVLVGDDDPQG